MSYAWLLESPRAKIAAELRRTCIRRKLVLLMKFRHVRKGFGHGVRRNRGSSDDNAKRLLPLLDSLSAWAQSLET